MQTGSRHRRVATLLAALSLVGLLAGPALAEKYLGKSVTVHKKGGGVVIGRVVIEEEGKKIVIDSRSARITVVWDDIDRVEVKKAPAEEFKDRAAAAKSAEDWYKLAQWCGQPDVKLPDERLKALNEAIKLDPNHKQARAELGQVRDEKTGNWVDEESYHAGKGWVKLDDGRWVSPEEAEKIKAEKGGFIKGADRIQKQYKGVPWAVARTLKSKNYLLKCNSTEDVAQRYLKVMESLHRKYSEVLSDYQLLYTGPGKVYIFKNRDEFMDTTLSSPGVGGFFSHLDQAVRAYHGSFGVTGSTDEVLAHEATHQFQHRIMKQMHAVPTWLIEGMAVYFGDGTDIRPDAVKLHVIPRDRLFSLQRAMEVRGYVPLKRLLVIPRSGNTMPCYDHGWGVIFWCLQGDNPKYQFGHKGEGKRIWNQYLRHATTEITELPKPGFLQKEAEYFQSLILKETGAASIEKWEEDYKKFIMALRQDPVGEWKGREWSGWTTVGVRFTMPEKFTKVEEKELRHHIQEAAAATTPEGVRLWLLPESSHGQPGDVLMHQIMSNFTDVEYEDEYKEEESKTIRVNNAFDVAVTAFRGKYRQRKESRILSGPSKGEGTGKAAKKIPADKPAARAPDADELLKVRVGIFTTPEKFYAICLSGPEAPFSKVEGKFQEVLNSVRINYDVLGSPR